MKGIKIGLLSLWVFTVAGAAQAQPPPCTGDAHRQFDFWVGEWQVTKPDGSVAGQNRIEKILGGCVLHEQWSSAAGPYQGESFNLYDAPRGVWHQSWVDNGGLLLSLEGGLRDGAMVLMGDRPGKDGQVARHRITWTPNADGTVRQLWETSTDGGKTWATAFNGLYSRKP